MKKILLLVSFLAIGMYTNNQVKAKEEKSDVAEVENVTSVSEIAEINQIESGGETTALPTKKQKAQRSTETKTFELKRYFAQIKDGSSGTELVPMPNVDFKISYKLNGKDVFFYENGRTNEKGEVLDIPAVEIPAEVNSIRVWYYLGNEERGYIQKYNKTKYCFIVTQNIPTESVSINYWCNFWIGSTTDQDTAFYNFQAARQNYYFDRAVKEFQEIIKKTNNLFPDTVSFEVAPINVNFEKGKFTDQGNGFWRNGHDNSKTPDLTICDKSNKNFTESSVKHNIMHEWTHWNSYRETQMGMGKETASVTLRNSYREGWAYLVGYMFSRSYDLADEDLIVQNDKMNGINRYFGKPTIMTAKQVLYDLLDVTSSDEDFSLSQRYFDDDLSELEQRRMNLGLMHTIMVESKATTLQEFLNYTENKYILTASDKKKYEKVLEINGLNRDGSFKFDEYVSPFSSNDDETENVLEKEEMSE